MEYYSTFFTHSAAIGFSRFISRKGIENESAPVPRKLSSNCGIGVRFSYDGELTEIYFDDMERLYRIESDKFILIKDFE
ncbi:MAG: DUF3343 domain-containing protein [Clostridioides sp.]|jgi:hypothetical protein|nr:DUF3343 domain-containing protein [Clostridioides sp.]